MPLSMTASPATVEQFRDGEVWGHILCDPNEVKDQASAATLAEAEAAFAAFAERFTSGQWIVSALWAGPDKPPRGFKAARERGSFRRNLDLTAKAA